MRISDLSSDVCSSDLHDEEGFLLDPDDWYQELMEALAEETELSMTQESEEIVMFIRDHFENNFAVDRKLVVEGKSVSVRVDLGGRRIIKKKQTSAIISLANPCTRTYNHSKLQY